MNKGDTMKDFFHTGLQVSRSDMVAVKNVLNLPGQVFYVSRNQASSGDGSSWAQAFVTIGEGIAALNAAAVNDRWLSPGGRNSVLYIDEGWYSEIGLILTASDCRIIATGPGSRINDGTILYGSATQGGWDAGALIPALRITGSSVEILGMGFMNSASGLYPCVTVGTQGASGPSNNLFEGCYFPRDVADAYTFAIDDLSNEGTVIKDCYFSQSAKTAGVSINTNGVTNPVNNRILDSTFIGTPVGIYQGAGHNTIIKGNWFIDATDDRPDTIDNPLNIVATSAYATGNFAPNSTLAEFDAGSVAVTLGNMCSDSDNADWPQGG
jgi:hypothetical protein